MADERDTELRATAIEAARALQHEFTDLIPRAALNSGFIHRGRRISFGSFYSGIFRPKEMDGPAAVMAVDRSARMAQLEAGLPLADTTAAGLVSGPDMRRYATREAVVRLHQHRFRAAVLTAYGSRCAVCTLREVTLLQAAHILDDRHPNGIAAVINGIALCAIHHLAYDRNLMGIDPTGMVHIAERLLKEIDGPMLRTGLQGFHGGQILQPRREEDRPDPARLGARFERFSIAAA